MDIAGAIAMYDDIITLVRQEKAVDSYGDTVISETERTVFAEVRDVTQTEFYQAQANGVKAEIKFILADFLEYEDEQMIRYTRYGGTEQLYTIIRTYRNNNELELVCRKGAVDDGDT